MAKQYARKLIYKALVSAYEVVIHIGSDITIRVDVMQNGCVYIQSSKVLGQLGQVSSKEVYLFSDGKYQEYSYIL